MSKRITLSTTEITILDMVITTVLEQRNHNVITKVGAKTLTNILRKLGVKYDATKRREL